MQKIIFGISCFLFIGLFVNCEKTKLSAEDIQQYVDSVNVWHQQRIERLKKPDGWLSLIGLYRLMSGENTFGSDSGNAIVFPPKAPKSIGKFLVDGDEIRVHIKPGIQVLSQQKTVTELQLQSDVENSPTLLTLNSLSWYVIKRGESYLVRLKDSESPLIRNFRGIERYPVDPRWRVKARFIPYQPSKKIPVPNVLGTVFMESSPGALIFKIKGKEFRLDPIAEAGAERYFVIFGDQTNGFETYGAGRFLYIDKPGTDEVTFIDFNKSYNPPCAFTPYATCPLPPSQNKLPVKITAGEKKYAGGHH